MNTFSRDKEGAAQIIEMALILPIVMGVVMTLFYLIFAVFFMVSAQSLAEEANDTITTLISTECGENENLYWQLFGDYLSPMTQAKVQAEYENKLEGLCVLPGTDASFSFNLQRVKPSISTTIRFYYFKHRLFTITADREVFAISDFANNTDFLMEAETKWKGLKKICNEIDEVL